MAHLSDGLFFKPLLGFFSASVFQHIILLLTDSCGGLPQGTLVASVGDDVILPCHLEPAADAVSKTLEWGRPDLEPRFVHVWYQRRDYLVNQNPSYKGRTSVSIEQLQQGDLSLKLSALKPSDNGIYRCYFPSENKHSTVELIVGSVSSPLIADIYLNSREVVLQCESKGWYPEPEVLWLDGEGNLVSAGPTEKVLGPDHLYAVSSRATVEKRRSNSFTCRVQQKAINQTRETHIQVSADCLEVTSCYAVRLSVTFGIFFLFTFAVAFVLWRWRQNQTREAKKHRKAEAEKREKLMAKDKMVKKKAKLNEELQQKEEEKKNLDEVVKTLKKHKEELEKQKQQLKDQKEEMDKTIKDTESVEKMTDSDQTHTITLTAKKQLRDRKQVDENLMLQTEKLLNETNTLLNIMTERRKVVENHMKKIKETLEEIERKHSE
ncbi:butyrophilin subfamily 3 member A2-like [Pempheris klunzingeri]|uniref:butyrophilin subfamily 3 member A2-like n=1 Tax=Pempheris klunzingeri TaxID=3127111 RepID=UPI00397F2602